MRLQKDETDPGPQTDASVEGRAGNPYRRGEHTEAAGFLQE